jgi:hypothetical protein
MGSSLVSGAPCSTARPFQASHRTPHTSCRRWLNPLAFCSCGAVVRQEARGSVGNSRFWRISWRQVSLWCTPTTDLTTNSRPQVSYSPSSCLNSGSCRPSRSWPSFVYYSGSSPLLSSNRERHAKAADPTSSNPCARSEIMRPIGGL